MRSEITLKLKAEKKHSVVYEPAAETPDPIVTSIYVMKVGMMKAGATSWPQTLKLTVEG